MNSEKIISELAANRQVFSGLLSGIGKEMHEWRSNPESWNLQEIVCHLYDEEREDFRARTKHVLETPGLPLSPIDPVGWVQSRNYMQQDYGQMLEKFLEERSASVSWLRSLTDPAWHNAHIHPKFGPMPAKMFLANWLAHDHLHIRQIARLKFEYLKSTSGETLQYAGAW
ncbi:MAG: hypothetical protein FD123_3659 [Bacteroidetes bacterium]|nr:MAG: hypothetical protein FD123_3659 [Bacteroidota bacterium]